MKTKLVLLSFIMTSCSPLITIVDTSCPGYKKPDFTRSDITEHGIGIMPVLGGDEKEQFRRPMGEAMTEHFIVEFGQEKVISPSQVINVLNENNLTDEYTQAINDYRISGIVPRDMVISLGDALEVDYLLYTRLLADADLTILGIGDFATTARIDEIYIQCQVWDTNIGDVVWEGKGGTAKLETEDADIISNAAEGLSLVIGNEPNNGPCQDKKTIQESIAASQANTYLAIGGISVVLLIILALI